MKYYSVLKHKALLQYIFTLNDQRNTDTFLTRTKNILKLFTESTW